MNCSGPTPAIDHSKAEYYEVAIDDIVIPPGRKANPKVVRQIAESIQRLDGLINPPILNCEEDEEGDWGMPTIVAGHCRVEAARLLGWETIPAIVMSLPEITAAAIEADENLIRRHLTREEREELRLWRDERIAQLLASGKSRRKIAEEIGVSVRTVQRACSTSGSNAGDSSGVSGDTPEPGPQATVSGLDGKQYRATKPSPAELDARRNAVAIYKDMGKPSQEIARMLGVSVGTVVNDWKKVKAGRNVEEQPVEEQPVEEQPVEEQPVEEQPVEEQPVEEQPVEEQPVEADRPWQNDPEQAKRIEQGILERERPAYELWLAIREVMGVISRYGSDQEMDPQIREWFIDFTPIVDEHHARGIRFCRTSIQSLGGEK